jgi:hypothetical protein
MAGEPERAGGSADAALPAAAAPLPCQKLSHRETDCITTTCESEFSLQTGPLGEAHLRRILQAYARYYNDVRTHRSLDKDAPLSRPVQRIGRIESHALIGGLHRHYCRNLVFGTHRPTERSSPRQFFLDCTIAMRGYDLREGQRSRRDIRRAIRHQRPAITSVDTDREGPVAGRTNRARVYITSEAARLFLDLTKRPPTRRCNRISARFVRSRQNSLSYFSLDPLSQVGRRGP